MVHVSFGISKHNLAGQRKMKQSASQEPITHVAVLSRNRTLFRCVFRWQSRVEIKHYSVVYFDRSTVLEAL